MPIASSSQSLGSMRSTAIRDFPVVLGWMAATYRKSIPRARTCQSDFREELFPSKKLHSSKPIIGLNLLDIVGKCCDHTICLSEFTLMFSIDETRLALILFG